MPELVEPITLKDLQIFFGGKEDGKQGFTARKFQRLIQRGCLEATRIGRFTFLTKKQMDDWFDRHTSSPKNNFVVNCPYCQKFAQKK